MNGEGIFLCNASSRQTCGRSLRACHVSLRRVTRRCEGRMRRVCPVRGVCAPPQLQRMQGHHDNIRTTRVMRLDTEGRVYFAARVSGLVVVTHDSALGMKAAQVSENSRGGPVLVDVHLMVVWQPPHVCTRGSSFRGAARLAAFILAPHEAACVTGTPIYRAAVFLQRQLCHTTSSAAPCLAHTESLLADACGIARPSRRSLVNRM